MRGAEREEKITINRYQVIVEVAMVIPLQQQVVNKHVLPQRHIVRHQSAPFPRACARGRTSCNLRNLKYSSKNRLNGIQTNTEPWGCRDTLGLFRLWLQLQTNAIFDNFCKYHTLAHYLEWSTHVSADLINQFSTSKWQMDNWKHWKIFSDHKFIINGFSRTRS